MRNSLKKFLSIPLLICMIVGMVTSASAFSVKGERASITALYLIDEKPVQDVSIFVHRIASVDDDLNYTWLDAYSKYKLTVDFNNDDKMAEVAQTLASYVSRDSVAATAQAKTNEDGYASFDNLTPGMYLVTGEIYRAGRYTYRIVPTLIPLPNTAKDGTLTFDANVELKHESTYHPPEEPNDDTTIRRALKVWDMGEGRANIPESIKVDLLRDGRLYDTQRLNNQNNWTYTWRNLDDSYSWTIVEQSVPDGFTTSASKNGITYVITNTESPATPPPDNPPIDSGEPNEPTDPDNPVVPEEPNQPVTPNQPEKLPQTGMLWWPVLVLAPFGIGLIIGAAVCSRSSDKKIKVKYILLAAGMILIAWAAYLTGQNIGEDHTAGESSGITVRRLVERIPDVEADAEVAGEDIIPNYILNPGMEMPEIEVDGRQYIGVLDIPVLDLNLPILTEWSKQGAVNAPCRYEGSIYDNNCIIAGHNYKSHFAKLNALEVGDRVIFTDVEGNEFQYTVAETEVIDGTDIEGMKSGDWDLTLFTCTIGGRQRITIRCQEANF